MYALIIVIAVLSPATGAVTPVGVGSHIVGKFKNLDQCKATAAQGAKKTSVGRLTVIWIAGHLTAKPRPLAFLRLLVRKSQMREASRLTGAKQ